MKYKLEWKEKKKYFDQVRSCTIKTNTKLNAQNILKKEYGKKIEILNCEEIVENDNDKVDEKR